MNCLFTMFSGFTHTLRKSPCSQNDESEFNLINTVHKPAVNSREEEVVCLGISEVCMWSIQCWRIREGSSTAGNAYLRVCAGGFL